MRKEIELLEHHAGLRADAVDLRRLQAGSVGAVPVDVEQGFAIDDDRAR